MLCPGGIALNIDLISPLDKLVEEIVQGAKDSFISKWDGVFHGLRLCLHSIRENAWEVWRSPRRAPGAHSPFAMGGLN